MKILPPKGMNDALPREMAVRDALIQQIVGIYKLYGYQRIQTPVLEDAENLQKSEGGDNLNLIYQVMKRGAKLDCALAKGEQLWDLGLRYDLTLPLSRFYAANHAKLPQPFKCIQVDKVYRAERPQKGRMREFVQCDIDIVGDESTNAEIELVAVTARALMEVGFEDFVVHLNDRRILNGFLRSLGYAEDQLPGVCVAFDKLDKIGVSGVLAELEEKGFGAGANAAFADFLKKADFSLEALKAAMGDIPEVKAMEGLLGQLSTLSKGKWQCRFSLSLVRGQGYYTGTVFEIECPGYSGSVAGGGRYDNMIGKFQNARVPAVGFSIGFERIASILLERGYNPPGEKPRLALVYTDEDNFADVLTSAEALQGEYCVAALPRQKNMGKQAKRLAAEGYAAMQVYGRDEIENLQA